MLGSRRRSPSLLRSLVACAGIVALVGAGAAAVGAPTAEAGTTGHSRPAHREPAGEAAATGDFLLATRNPLGTALGGVRDIDGVSGDGRWMLYGARPTDPVAPAPEAGFFEAYYLTDTRTGRTTEVERDGGAPVLSHDGRFLALSHSSASRTVLRDRDTGREVRLPKDTGVVSISDGARDVLEASEPRGTPAVSVDLWDRTTHTRTPIPHVANLGSIALSGDGRYLAELRDSRLTVRNLATGRSQSTPTPGSGGRSYSMSISGDGRYVAYLAPTDDGTRVARWDRISGRTYLLPLVADRSYPSVSDTGAVAYVPRDDAPGAPTTRVVWPGPGRPVVDLDQANEAFEDVLLDDRGQAAYITSVPAGDFDGDLDDDAYLWSPDSARPAGPRVRAGAARSVVPLHTSVAVTGRLLPRPHRRLPPIRRVVLQSSEPGYVAGPAVTWHDVGPASVDRSGRFRTHLTSQSGTTQYRVVAPGYATRRTSASASFLVTSRVDSAPHRRDLRLVGADRYGGEADDDSQVVAIASGARSVLLLTDADGLAASDHYDGGTPDLYLLDAATGRTTNLTRSVPDTVVCGRLGPIPYDPCVDGAGMSDDGDVVAFASDLPGLTPEDRRDPGDRTDEVYLWRRDSSASGGTITSVARDASSPVLSGDGRWLAYVSERGLVERDLATGDETVVSSDTAARQVLVDGDGSSVAYQGAGPVGAGPSGDYLWDRDSGRSSLLAAPGSDGYPPQLLSMSDDASRILWTTQESDEPLAIWSSGTVTPLPLGSSCVGDGSMSGDGSTVAVDGCGELYDVDSGTTVPAVTDLHGKSVGAVSMTFSGGDGRYVGASVTASYPETPPVVVGGQTAGGPNHGAYVVDRTALPATSSAG